MAGNVMSIRQTNVHYMVTMFEQLEYSYTYMILHAQPTQVQVAVNTYFPM